MKLTRPARRALTGLAVLASAAVAIPVTASTASAADAICPSGEYTSASENFYDNGGNLAAIAHLYSYRWGTCADLVAQGSYYGQSKYMSISTYSDNATSASDSGTYRYYAGPISLNDSVAGLCATTHVVMHYPNGAGMINTSGPGSICD